MKKDYRSWLRFSPLPFWILKFASFVGASIVTSIMVYFIYHLQADNFRIPWSFFLITATSVLTLLYHLIITTIQLKKTLGYILTLVLEILLTVLWTATLLWFSKNVAHTIVFPCTVGNWGTSTGVSVCHTYKALFTFTIISVAAHLGAVTLIVLRRRWENRTGGEKYSMMADEILAPEYDSHGHARGDSSNNLLYNQQPPGYSHTRTYSSTGDDDPFSDPSPPPPAPLGTSRDDVALEPYRQKRVAHDSDSESEYPEPLDLSNVRRPFENQHNPYEQGYDPGHTAMGFGLGRSDSASVYSSYSGSSVRRAQAMQGQRDALASAREIGGSYRGVTYNP